MTPSENIRYYIDIEGKTPAEAAQLARDDLQQQEANKRAGAENNPRPMLRKGRA